jgi:photosystem II stability/assembly factor-like uncharacterized protein
MRVALLAGFICLAGCTPPTSTSGDLGPGGTGGGSGGPHPGGGGNWLTGMGGVLVNAPDGNDFEVRASGGPDLYALFCVGDQHGWAAGAEGTLMTTLDGGASWVPRATGVEGTLRAVAFADFSTGVAVGDDGALVRSVDGGESWMKVDAPSVGLHAAAISAGGAAWVVGDAGTVLRSRDGGASFTRVSGLPNIELTGVRFATDAQRGFVSSADGTLWRSLDGGAHFTQIAHASQPLAGLSVTRDGSRVVAVGASGAILRSVDGGDHVTELSGNTSLDLSAVGFADDAPDQGLAIGQHGTILRSTDGGLTWEAVPSPSQADYTAVEDF